MASYFGIAFALAALLCWGVGDFFIQRSTRRVGVWETLFWNELAATIILFPFVIDDLRDLSLTSPSFFLLSGLSLVVLFAAPFDFTALRDGKIAVVEPIQGLELPITIALSVGLLGEQLSGTQLALMVAVFVGIILAVTTTWRRLHYHRRVLERGVLFAGLGAIAMAAMNFLVGVASQQTSPLLTLWFFSAFLLIVCTAYLAVRTGARTVLNNFWQHISIISAQAIVDNLAWVAFAFATTLIPISIATTISESYIALAAMLGIIVSRERLRTHQLLGVALAIGGVIALSMLTANNQ